MSSESKTTSSPPTVKQLTKITGNSKTAAQIHWLTEELNRMKVQDNYSLRRANMIAEIRSNMFRMNDVEKRYYQAVNVLNGIQKDVMEFWNP